MLNGENKHEDTVYNTVPPFCQPNMVAVKEEVAISSPLKKSIVPSGWWLHKALMHLLYLDSHELSSFLSTTSSINIYISAPNLIGLLS